MAFTLIRKLLEKLRGSAGGNQDAALVKRLLKRRQRIQSGLKHLDFVSASFVYLLALSFSGLSRGTFVSENALQPAQVNTYWGWGEVHQADLVAKSVQDWASLDSAERAAQIEAYLNSIGQRAAIQCYNISTFSSLDTEPSGCNAYGLIQSPKTDGAEALVVAASWLSRDSHNPGRVNTRGVAAVLTLAKHLSKYSLWSKDIIILISDGYLAGTQAWISAYHGQSQQGIQSQELPFKTGPIWAALHVDYPHHSFSHLGVFFEATNGLLPNLDLVTSVLHIAKWAGGTPIILHDTFDEHRLDKYQHLGPLGRLLDATFVKDFELVTKNIFQQVKRQTFGCPSGPEGLYARYRIDAVAIYAVPAEGPHGFYSIGRTVESTLRSLNNILERLHASAFLYLMTGSKRLIGLANYLAVPLLAGIALSLRGLSIWASLFPRNEISSPRPVGRAIVITLSTHFFGSLVLQSYNVMNIVGFRHLTTFTALSAILFAYGFGQVLPPNVRPTLASFNLLSAGMVICVVAVLNFSLSVYLSLLLGLPLMLANGAHRNTGAFVCAFSLLLSSSGVYQHLSQQLIFERTVLASWHMPFIALVVLPLQMQAFIVATMAH